MLEGEPLTLSDLSPSDFSLETEDLNVIQNGLIEPDSVMGQMLNFINEETTISMEEYEYLNQTNYQFPPNEPQEVGNTDYSGPYEFEVFVDPNVMKNPWEYSLTLNKIYIDMKHKFPINFSINNKIEKDRLFIRILPLFEEDRYYQDIVHRCYNHEQSTDTMNHNVPNLVRQHIIRCDNTSSQYCGDRNMKQRLSIVIPLGTPQAGTDSVKEFFHFVCKNSCVGGMNRRPIQIIFTLEDEGGVVLGRRVLSVRICSCPKRDREKDEQKKENVRTSKKRKIEKKTAQSSVVENVDTSIYSTNLNIVGKENLKALLKYAQVLMGNEMSQSKSPNHIALFKKHKDDIGNILNTLSE